jgi:hypothetical protein
MDMMKDFLVDNDEDEDGMLSLDELGEDPEFDLSNADLNQDSFIDLNKLNEYCKLNYPAFLL